MTKTQKQLIMSLGSTFFWMIIAHGYRFVNLLFSHDSLYTFVQEDIYWQRSLGRFLQPFIIAIRGKITAPWLIFLTSTLFASLAVFFVCQIFEFSSFRFYFLIAAVFICNPVITTTNCAYLPWLDIYMLALLCSALGIWLFLQKRTVSYLLGIVSLVASLGLYQAYISVGVTLFMILIIRKIYKKNELKEVKSFSIRALLFLLSAAVLYFVLFKGICYLHKIEAADTANGLTKLSGFWVSIGELFVGTYQSFFERLFLVDSFSNTVFYGISMKTAWELVILVVNIMVCLFALTEVFILLRKKQVAISSRFIVLGLLLLYPLASNFIYVLSQGVEHILMVFSVQMVYVFLLVTGKDFEEELGKERIVKTISAILIGILVWNNIVFSNQIYTKMQIGKEIMAAQTPKLMAEIEKAEGYVPGNTQVVIAGSFETAPSINVPSWFNDVKVMGGGNTPLTYRGTFEGYFEEFAGENINIADTIIPDDILKDKPIYPEKGSIFYYNDILVVKISD